MFDITFMFNRCTRSIAATTSVKYERDSTEVTDILTQANIS